MPTYSCNDSAKQFGPALKLILCPVIVTILISWLPCGIISAVLAGAAYGLLGPMFATFEAMDEGKTDKFYHCICVCDSTVCIYILCSLSLLSLHAEIVTGWNLGQCQTKFDHCQGFSGCLLPFIFLDYG